MKEAIQINLSRAKVFCVFKMLIGFELFIVFLDVFVNHFKWASVGAVRRMVNITREDALANWFSSIQAISVGLILAMVAVGIFKDPNSSKSEKYSWAFFSGFFVFIGVDDAIKFHERMGTLFKAVMKDTSVLEIFPSYPWQLIFVPFFGAVGLYMLWFLFKELKDSKQFKFIVIALSLYSLAVFIDFFEGLENPPYEGLAEMFSTKVSTIRHFSKTIEEFLEMLGTSFFLLGFLNHLLFRFPKWTITVKTE